MPPIRSLQINPDGTFQIDDGRQPVAFDTEALNTASASIAAASSVVTDSSAVASLPDVAPPVIEAAPAQQLEDYINDVWVPANVSDYQCLVHVASVDPLVVNVCTADVGAPILEQWWADQ